MNRRHANLAIVIPTCDRPEYLREAILSVRQQTLAPSEVIICDNGFSQELPIALQDNELHLNLKPRIGASAARNAGLFSSNQEFVAFLDDDDTWDPRFLEKAYERINADGADCAFGRRDKLANGQVYRTASPQPKHLTVNYLMCKNPFFGGSNILVRSAMAKKVGGYDTSLPRANDTGFLIDLLLAGAKVSIEPDAVAYCRDHGGPRVTSNHWQRWHFLYKYAGKVPFRNLAVAIVYYLYGGIKKTGLRVMNKS